MTPPYTLRFGSVDLAPYLRIGNDEGFDPYDGGGFEEPAFTDNPFGEGQGLSNVDARNREMSWPLYLNATTKDGLHSLVRQINQEIRYAARPLRVEWKDQDATASTFFDVEFARFDPNFRMRPSAQKWLAGVLRVWTKPYGHTATWRTIATGRSRLGTYPVPSLAGDVDAQLRVDCVASDYGARSVVATRYTDHIISVLPYGWTPWLAPSAVRGGQGSVIGASGAIGSQIRRHVSGNLAAVPVEMNFIVPSSMASPFRAIAVVRHFQNATHAYYTRQQTPQATYVQLAPTTMIGRDDSEEWLLVDLGEFDAPYRGGTYEFINVNVTGTTVPTIIFDVAGMFLLPPEQTVVWRDGDFWPAGGTAVLASHAFSGEGATVVGQHNRAGVGTTGFDLRAYPVGAMPAVCPGVSQSVFVARLDEGWSSNAVAPNVSVSVRERFTFAR